MAKLVACLLSSLGTPHRFLFTCQNSPLSTQWVSWSAFVGLFVARISRGRTVGEVILYSMVAPSLYCTVWFCVWGGVGLRQARQAMEMQQLGLNNFGDEDYYQTAGREECYDVPQSDVTVNGTTVFSNKLMGVTPVCLFASSGDAPFNVLYSFSYPDSFGTGSGPFLSVLFIIALVRNSACVLKILSHSLNTSPLSGDLFRDLVRFWIARC